MELKTAIEILEYHQEWRLGKREDMIHEPKKLTEALDVVLNEVKKLLPQDNFCKVCNLPTDGEKCYSKRCPVGSSVTYQGVTYNWGDKVVSPNEYEFFVVTDDGRWGLVDDGGTFCELQHCDLTGYLHCH